MGNRFRRTISIAAGAQFVGTELAGDPVGGKVLAVRAIYLHMGSEAKSWQIAKTISYDAPDNASVTVSHVFAQSLNGGVFGTSTGTDRVINGPDADGLVLFPGDQIQIRSGTNTSPAGTNASAAMQASIEFEEIDIRGRS